MQADAVIPRDKGTAETRRKLRFDVIDAAHRDGRLDDRQLVTAQRIQDIVWLRQRAFFGGSIRQTRIDGSPFRDFVDRLPAGVVHEWQSVYLPWAAAMNAPLEVTVGQRGRKPVVYRYNRPTTLATVYLVAVDNWGTGQVEQYFDLRHGVAIRALRSALDDYADRLGQ